MSAASHLPEGFYARRPARAARYTAEVARWLRDEPTIPAVEIMRRAKALGYSGGKSAFYELVRRVRTLDEQRAGSRQLVVVSPGQEHLYNFFKRAFEGNPTVQIILDRRAERPQNPEFRPGAVRLRDRRSPERGDHALPAIGWCVVSLPSPKIRRSSVSS